MVVCRITSIVKRKRGQRLRKELRRALGGREELQADWEHTAVVLREAVWCILWTEEVLEG